MCNVSISFDGRLGGHGFASNAAVFFSPLTLTTSKNKFIESSTAMCLQNKGVWKWG